MRRCLMREDSALGKMEVSPKAIASIAAEAVMNCYGIVGMAPAKLGNGITEMLTGDSLHRGIEVKLVNGKIVIDLYVIVEYGTRISEVAQNVMQSVKFNVESSLGMSVSEVNVHVQGLRVSDRD
jgi:uncharacterized alkaline shock family protein YloU